MAEERRGSVSFEDFSGGITDDIVSNNVTKYEKCDNLILTDDRTLKTRPGSLIFDAFSFQIPAGEQRIGALINFEENTKLIVNSARNFYDNRSSTWQTILGPITLAQTQTLANELKADYNLHRVDTPMHTVAADNTNIVTAADASDLATLKTLVTELALDLNAHFTDANLTSGFAFHDARRVGYTVTVSSDTTDLATTIDTLKLLVEYYNVHDLDDTAHGTLTAYQTTSFAGNLALDVGLATAKVSSAQWRGHLFVTNDEGAKPSKIYVDENSDLQVRTAGLTPVDNSINYSEDTTGATALAEAIALSNDLKDRFNSHAQQTPKHAVAESGSDLIGAPDATDLATMITLLTEFLTDWRTHYNDAFNPSPTIHQRQELGDMYVNPSTYSNPTNLAESRTLALNFKHDFNIHDSKMSAKRGTGNSHDDGPTFVVEKNIDLLTMALKLANEIRTDIKVHLADTATKHIIADTVSDGFIGSAATDLDSLFVLTKELLDAQTTHVRDLQGKFTTHKTGLGIIADSTELFQPSIAAQIPASNFTPTTIEEAAELLNDVKLKYNTHEFSNFLHNDAGWDPNVENNVNTADLDFSKGPSIVQKNQYILDFAASVLKTFDTHLATTTSFGGHGTAADTVNDPDNLVFSNLIDIAHAVDQIRSSYHGVGVTGGHEGDGRLVTPVFHSATQVTANNLVQNQAMSSSNRWKGIVPGNIVDAATVLNDFKAKLNLHMAETPSHDIAAVGFITLPDIALKKYSWAYHYTYEYQVGDVKFKDFGPVLIKTFDNLVDPELSPIDLENIVALSNGTTDNYDLVNVKLQINRTIGDGATFFKVDEISATTTTFTDRVTDSELILREQMYTTGGVVSNDPPPISKFIHIVNGFGYYLNIVTEDGETIKGRLLQSKLNDPDSVPANFFVDTDEEGLGINSAGSKPVIFTDRGIYRQEGTVNNLGQGVMNLIKISDKVILSSNDSIIQREKDLLFAGQDGFYITNAFEVKRISDFPKTFKDLFNRGSISAEYDEKNKIAQWAVQRTSSNTDNDSFFSTLLNERAEQRLEKAFQTASNGSDFAPSVLGYFNDQLIRGDRRGYLFKHDEANATDPLIDTTKNPSAWETKVIDWDYKSVATDFGVGSVRKYVTSLAVKLKKKTDITLGVNSDNDLGRVTSSLKTIVVQGINFQWGDPLFVWGSLNCMWNNTANSIESFRRRFASRGLRCENKQIQFTNAKVAILNSDTADVADINAAANTLTLPASPDVPWRDEFLGYFLAFEQDNFVKEFEVSEVTSTLILTFLDPDNFLFDKTGSKWVLRAKPKGEVFELSSFKIFFNPLTNNSRNQFPGGTEGENS